MDGITILNEITKTIEPMPIHTWYLILLGTILCTVLVVIAIVPGVKEEDFTLTGSGSVFGVLVGFLWVLVFITHSDTQREPYTITQYEVTISDEITFKDLTERYKVIEQRNDIYVIQKINNDKQ